MSVSLHGSKFKELVCSTLKNLEHSGTIYNLKENVRIGNQFFAPFVFGVNGLECALFCTTSARADRLKTHQWDSWGINSILGKKVKCFVVLPNNLSEKELFFAEKEIKRIKSPDYISMID
ncbi:MAG: hypothetical protein WC461_02825 [Candidatus Paceibacterota bacterium]